MQQEPPSYVNLGNCIHPMPEEERFNVTYERTTPPPSSG